MLNLPFQIQRLMILIGICLNTLSLGKYLDLDILKLMSFGVSPTGYFNTPLFPYEQLRSCIVKQRSAAILITKTRGRLKNEI